MSAEEAKVGEEEPVFDFGKKKQKKKKVAAAVEHEDEIIEFNGNVFKPGVLYNYDELLDRIQDLIQEKHPELQGHKKYTLKPPVLARVGSKKVAWVNFMEICGMMNRSSDHVLQFVLAELATEGSVAADGQLVLKGKFFARSVEKLLRKYITEYVTCQMCKSPNTQLERDSRTRLYNIQCKACGANRSVAAIKTGFHAVSRAARRKERANKI